MSTNEKPQAQLIVLEQTKKIVEFNNSFEQLEKEIVNQLNDDKYNSIVTMDNFKVMKETSQELGRIAKYVSDFRIAKVKAESTEIKLFEDNFKRVTNLIKEKQETIRDGLEVFEEQTKLQVKTVCKEYCAELIVANNIREEFANIDLEDMTQTGYMTAKGAISAKGKSEVEARVNLKLSLQNRTDMRIMQLENKCFKSGLQIPLSKEHVQGFLFDDDASYETKLNNLIVAEIARNERVAEIARNEAEIKVREEIKQEQVQKLTPFGNVEEVVQEAVNEPAPAQVPVDGKIEKTLSIKIRVPKNATDAQIIDAIINMIKADNFPIENIEVK